MALKKTPEFMIVNRRSKKALQATGAENGPVVEQAAPSGSDAQLWSLEPAGDCIKLKNKMSGKVLDVMAEGTVNGTWLQTWEDVGGESQLWQFVKLTATYGKLLNVRSGRVADIVDMSDGDGAAAQIWDDVGGDGQQWKLVPTDKPAPKKPGPKKSAVKSQTVKKTAPKVAAATVTGELHKAEAAPAKRGRKPAAKKAATAAAEAVKEETQKAAVKTEETVKTIKEEVKETAPKAAAPSRRGRRPAGEKK